MLGTPPGGHETACEGLVMEMGRKQVRNYVLGTHATRLILPEILA